MIDENYSVFGLVGCLGWANGYAEGLFAMLALFGKVKVVELWEISFRTHRVYLRPEYTVVDIILNFARYLAAFAANAFVQIHKQSVLFTPGD
jgi:hypothetical protein